MSAFACARPPLLSPGEDVPATAGSRVPPVPEATTPCDRDGDGHLAVDCGGDDCDDTNASIHPGALDLNARPGPWTTSRAIANTGGANGGTAIAVDRTGVVHIVYSGRSAPGLLYATRTGEAWRVEMVDSFRSPYFIPEDRPAIAVDARGRVHVAYASSASVRYAVREQSGWTVETIDPAGQAPPALAVAPDGIVHVAYATEGGLRHAARRSGTWVGEIVDPSGAVPSMAIDSQGTIHLAYADATKGAEVLHHATGVADAWTTEIASNTRAASSSIVIDGLGLPRIALTPRYTTDGGVRYLVRGGGQWSEAALPATNDVYSSTLRLDGAGVPHILFSYLIETTYAVQESGTWVIETPVFSYGLYDVQPSFDLDGAGVAHVALTSFFYPDNINVEYSTNRQLAPDGVDQNCDGVDGVDADRDGHASLATGGDDCDDDDPTSPVGCQ
jgi:hypothetical protein